MNHANFDKIVDNRLQKCRSVLCDKGKEYSRNGDRLWNFCVAALFCGSTKKQALWGMLVKHLVSVKDMIDDRSTPSDAMIDEKIGDVIN